MSVDLSPNETLASLETSPATPAEGAVAPRLAVGAGDSGVLRDERGAGRWLGAAAIVALTAATAWFRASQGPLPEAVGLHLGLPAFLALALILAPRPQHRIGRRVRWVTLGILVVGIVAMEGRVALALALLLFHYFSTLFSEESLHHAPDQAVNAHLRAGSEAEDLAAEEAP